MKRSIILALSLTLASLGAAFNGYAQAKFKPAPEIPDVELSGEDYKQLKAAQRDLRSAQLEVENLQLRIEQAQRQLTDLQRKSSDELERWRSTMTRLSKIPPDKLNEYTFIEKDGKFVITYSGPRK